MSRARAVVGVLSDPEATLRLVKTVRELAPGTPVVVRTRYRLEADRMELAGAAIAVAEELEASVEVVAQLAVRLHAPANVVDVLLEGTVDECRDDMRDAIAIYLEELAKQGEQAPEPSTILGHVEV